MSRKSYKSIIAVILSCFMIIQTFDFNCIYAHAATATAKFTDSKQLTVNMRCPGSYEVYRTDGPHDMDSTCHRTHVAGCDFNCSYDSSECRHFGEYDGRTSKSDIYGKFEIQTGHFCTGADGSEHEQGCWRTRATFTRCNVCHATVLDNSSNALQAIDVCARNGGRAHYVQLSSDGTPRCEYCGINAASTYYGKCNRNTNQTKIVSWKSGANYIDVNGASQNPTFSGSSDEQLLVKYDAQATVYCNATSSYTQGNIVGYRIIKNGSEGAMHGDSATTSALGFSTVQFSEKITDLTTVQFHIYTNAGDYYLPTVTLIPGTVITYDPNNGSKNIYDDNYTTTAAGTMEKTVVLPDSPVNLSDCAFTRKGYYFVGWSTEPDMKLGDMTDKTEYDTQASDLKVIANTKDLNTYYNGKNMLKGVTGERTNAEGAWRGIHTITLYAVWAPNYYKTYYERGLTDDTIHTDIANATRNNNIQSTGTNRPYTHDVFDRNMSLGTIGTVLGRNYTLVFNSNRPLSVDKQLQDKSAVPIETDTIKGNLLSANKWKISLAELNNDTEPTMNTLLTQPNYTSEWDGSATATALWQNKLLDHFSSPTLTGWKFVGWYDNQEGRDSTAVSNTTDMIREVNNETNVSPDTSVTVKGNVTSYTVQPKTTKFDQTLYARWQRTIHLTFDMNGGEYRGDPSDVILNGIYYNNADGYNFSLTLTPTAEHLPDYEKQQNQIDAYGTYDSNGENAKYTKIDDKGVIYRFLGWSLDKNAEEPDSSLIVYDSGRATNYRVYDDTTLYAVWEPVLIINFNLDRTLGNLNFSDGSSPVGNVANIRASSGTQYVSTIAKPGEQCNYSITFKGRIPADAYTSFDPKITDIYTHSGSWTDNLNPSTGYGDPTVGYEDLIESQQHGLDRHIIINNNYLQRKFYVPQYLGTKQSYETSIDITQYSALFEITQPSFYYKYVYNKLEQVEIAGTIYITTSKPTGGPAGDGGGGDSASPVISVLDELRAKLKIRLK